MDVKISTAKPANVKDNGKVRLGGEAPSFDAPK